jgi:hypothetical protein
LKQRHFGIKKQGYVVIKHQNKVVLLNLIYIYIWYIDVVINNTRLCG